MRSLVSCLRVSVAVRTLVVLIRYMSAAEGNVGGFRRICQPNVVCCCMRAISASVRRGRFGRDFFGNLCFTDIVQNGPQTKLIELDFVVAFL